jgi:hypothetical protein
MRRSSPLAWIFSQLQEGMEEALPHINGKVLAPDSSSRLFAVVAGYMSGWQ